MEHGVRTIVDPACMDLGRDARFAQRVAEETGDPARDVHRHLRPALPFLPAALPDARRGLPGRRLRPRHRGGHPGHRREGRVPQDAPSTSRASREDVEKVLRAAARASLRTGAADHGPLAPRQPHRARSDADLRRGGRRRRRRSRSPTPATPTTSTTSRSCWRAGRSSAWTATASTSSCPTGSATRPSSSSAGAATPSRMILSQDACATIDWFPEEMVAQLAPNWHFTLHLRGRSSRQLRELGRRATRTSTRCSTTTPRALAGGRLTLAAAENERGPAVGRGPSHRCGEPRVQAPGVDRDLAHREARREQRHREAAFELSAGGLRQQRVGRDLAVGDRDVLEVEQAGCLPPMRREEADLLARGEQDAQVARSRGDGALRERDAATVVDVAGGFFFLPLAMWTRPLVMGNENVAPSAVAGAAGVTPKPAPVSAPSVVASTASVVVPLFILVTPFPKPLCFPCGADSLLPGWSGLPASAGTAASARIATAARRMRVMRFIWVMTPSRRSVILYPTPS